MGNASHVSIRNPPLIWYGRAVGHCRSPGRSTLSRLPQSGRFQRRGGHLWWSACGGASCATWCLEGAAQLSETVSHLRGQPEAVRHGTMASDPVVSVAGVSDGGPPLDPQDYGLAVIAGQSGDGGRAVGVPTCWLSGRMHARWSPGSLQEADYLKSSVAAAHSPSRIH